MLPMGVFARHTRPHFGQHALVGFQVVNVMQEHPLAVFKIGEDVHNLLKEGILPDPDILIAFWDERLSTAAVEKFLILDDMSRKRRDEVVDKAAAAYILQGALDAIRHKIARASAKNPNNFSVFGLNIVL